MCNEKNLGESKMVQEETRLNIKSSCMEPKPSLRLVDVIINLLQRDRIEEAFECQLVAITFAVDNDMTTEEAMRMPLDDMVEMTPPPPPKIPHVRGKWDKIYYGEAAFKDEEK